MPCKLPGLMDKTCPQAHPNFGMPEFLPKIFGERIAKIKNTAAQVKVAGRAVDGEIFSGFWRGVGVRGSRLEHGLIPACEGDLDPPLWHSLANVPFGVDFQPMRWNFCFSKK